LNQEFNTVIKERGINMSIQSLAISGLMTLNLHSLNNEGAEGNYMQTRQVQIVDRNGNMSDVNAISGDMFKHIQGEHLYHLAKEGGLPLCSGCERFDANRIVVDQEFAAQYTKDTLDSEILSGAIQRCTLDDTQGILITSDIGKKRAIGRKSVLEFGWIVGRPETTRTDSYFHVKYAAEGRGKGAGEKTGAGNTGQNIFHRPASSGQYAVVLNLDLYRVGYNDILMQYALNAEERSQRIKELLKSVLFTFLQPNGAMRNTQNPHVLDFSGVMTLSSSTFPAPMVSALNGDYLEEIEKVARTLNVLKADSIQLLSFSSIGDFAEKLGGIIQEVNPAGMGM